jgi:chromosome segregation ATPase
MRSMFKSIFVRRERDVWATLQRHRAMLLCSNEQLTWRSAEVTDLTSQCEELKEEGAANRKEVCRLRDEVHDLKVNRHEEELRQVKESLQVVTVEQDKASLHIDSLSKSLEDERSKGLALNARIGGILSRPCFVFCSISYLSPGLMSSSTF